MQFSVIIPAKNAADFLAVAIMSALDQVETTVEVIVVDDGSTDGTGRIADEIRETDNRLVLLSNPVSVGVSAARNQAIAVAKGEWIAILDADDEFLPGRLSRMVQEAESRSLDMFADNLVLRSETGEQLGVAFLETELQGQKPISLDMFLMHDIPNMQPMGSGYCKPIVKKQFLTNHGLQYREGISCAEDFLFYAECLMAGAQFGFSKAAGYLYTVRSGGHGTAFNLQVSDVNRMITERARNLKPLSIPVLQMRQRAIDYDAFEKSMRARRFSEAMTSIRRLPPSLIVQYAANIAMKKTRGMLIGKQP